MPWCNNIACVPLTLTAARSCMQQFRRDKMQKINFWTLGNRNAAPQEKLSELGEMFFLQSQHLKIFHSSVSTSLSLPSILYSINFFSKTSFNENKCKCDMKHGVLGQPQCDCLPSAPRMTSKQKFCAGKLYPVFLTPFSFFSSICLLLLIFL